jgi:AcrR family transcriptional regulator
MARKQGSHGDITGPKVRAAALRLFARHGFAAVSMRQIAGEVGVQAGALYLYTADKQALLFELMRDHLTELLERLACAGRAHRSSNWKALCGTTSGSIWTGRISFSSPIWSCAI